MASTAIRISRPSGPELRSETYFAASAAGAKERVARLGKHLLMRDDAAPGPLTPAPAPRAHGGLGREEVRTVGSGPLNVEVADALGVRLNELFAGLHVGPHQLLEYVVDRCRIFDGDLKQHATRGIHGRLPELFGIHLTETLHSR